jgi:hypothetical protein
MARQHARGKAPDGMRHQSVRDALTDEMAERKVA